ncbi:MAG: universal stress protein [Planctomycetales bacterium]|nr:universal stress protein [Planctomycetales bacterium]
MLSNILVGLAGTKYAAAVEAAAIDLARRNRATLTAVTALNLHLLRDVGPVPPGAGQAANELRDYRVQITRAEVEASVARFQTACKAAGVAYRLKQEERDEPFDFLISRSRYADITVLSLRGIFEYDIRTETDSDASLTLVRLISGGVHPILAVPAEFRPVKRVFAAYSGSVESAATLRRFLQLHPFGDVELRIATFEMPEVRSAHLRSQVVRYCRGYGIDSETVHHAGAAKSHLLAEAEAWGADLVVMGNSAKNLLLRRILGETALRAMRESEIPLFLSQ